MTPERHRRIGELFDEALECPPAERGAWLARACGADHQLRAEVERLLAHEAESEGFLGQPAMQVAATLLAQNRNAAAAGRQISHYQLISLLGEGGMGEVWLARDTQLGRKVALKLLPAELTRSQVHLRRFAQEAKAASALSHPNIITIHEIGEDVGMHYIITEYVEGQTLRQLLTAPLPLKEMLDISIQIADALAAAHKAGIVHRDLKPENVMVRPDGLVKVLDFGLAKLTDRVDGAGEAMPATLVNTDPGTVMGTVSYMSPEQALAQPLDHRADIFSFGVMLYELIAGRRPFEGASTAAIYDAILHHDPAPVGSLATDCAEELQQIIERALKKDARSRFQSAADLKAALKLLKHDSAVEVKRTESGATTRSTPRQLRRSRIPKAAVAAGAALVMTATGFWYWAGTRTSTSSAPMVATFTQLTRRPGQEIYPSLSPDGKLLVYASDDKGDFDIYLQRASGTTSINLTGNSPAPTANDTQPSFSPDGERIVFRSDREGGGIFVMGATGENVRRLTDRGHNPAWSPNGEEIAYSDGSFARPSERGNYPGPLHVTKIATGETRRVTETDAIQPSWSPRGERIAYWGIRGGGQRDIWTVGAGGGDPVEVTNDQALDWNPIWSPDGRHLYFASDRGGSMNFWRVPIDERSGKLLGSPEPVTTPATYSGYVSFSRDGRHLVYAQIVSHINIWQAGFDPVRGKIAGNPTGVTLGARVATDPDLSPDSRWFVFGATGDKQEDLFMVRRDGSDLRQITDDKHRDRAPRWSPDGRRIIFFSDRSGRYEYWMIDPDGGGLRQFSYTSGQGVQIPVWSPDGLRLLCNFQTMPAYLVDPNRSWSQQTPQPLPAIGAPSRLMIWSWSADGRRLAGHDDGIFVYSFDTERYERFTDDGDRPVWLNDSQRLLYFSHSKLYLLDTRTRRSRELMNIAPNQFQSLGISHDGQIVYYSVKTNEADIWLATLGDGPEQR